MPKKGKAVMDRRERRRRERRIDKFGSQLGRALDAMGAAAGKESRDAVQQTRAVIVAATALRGELAATDTERIQGLDEMIAGAKAILEHLDDEPGTQAAAELLVAGYRRFIGERPDA